MSPFLRPALFNIPKNGGQSRSVAIDAVFAYSGMLIVSGTTSKDSSHLDAYCFHVTLTTAELSESCNSQWIKNYINCSPFLTFLLYARVILLKPLWCQHWNLKENEFSMNNICWHLVGIKLFSSFSCSFTCYSLFLSFFSFSHSFFFFSVSRTIFPSLYFFFSFSLMQARPLTHKYLRYFIFGNSQSSCLKKMQWICNNHICSSTCSYYKRSTVHGIGSEACITSLF